jgi:RNA recognition motif-containing protein
MTFQCSQKFFPVIRMNNKLFVGNLSFKLSEAELESMFGEFGTVVSCSIPTDRETGRKRGFAFVEMGSQAEAEAAIKGLNGRDCEGRQIAVSIAQPKPKGGGGGGGGGRRY